MKILVACLSDPSGDPRPNRIIRWLIDNGYSVDVLSYSNNHPSNLDIVNHFIIPSPGKSTFNRLVRLFLGYLSSLFALIPGYTSKSAIFCSDLRFKLNSIDWHPGNNRYDWIIVEDLQLLPIAFRIRKTSKILFDAREFYTRQNEESIQFRLFEYPLRVLLSQKYLKYCDHLMTVSPGLADAYMEDYGVKMSLLRSTPYLSNMLVNATKKDHFRLVHHGVANSNRGIENMIEIVKRLDRRFTLDLYLVGRKNNIDRLKKVAKGCDRVSFKTPVKFDEIIPMLNQYDIGFYYLEPKGFNVTYNLPNKFFEFIQARLAIAIGPSPDMAELIEEYQSGFVSKEFSIDSMVETLQNLTPNEIDLAKHNSDLAAKELCFEKESEKLSKILF